MALGCALVALFAAGCGGGGGSSASGGTVASGSIPAVQPTVAAPVQPAASAGTTTAAIRIVVPATNAAQNSRRVSEAVATIRGFAFVDTPAGGAALPRQTADVSASSPNCTPAAGGGRSCSIQVNVAAGASTLAVTSYDAPPAGGGPAGNVLSTASVPVSASPGRTNSIALTLNSVVASIALSYPNNVQTGQAGAVTIAVTASDADGNTIVSDAYANPITISTSDSSGGISLPTTTLRSPSDTVSLNYSGGVLPAGGFPIVVSAAGVAATAISGTTYRPLYQRSPVGTTQVYALSNTFTRTVAAAQPAVLFGTPFPSPQPTASFTPSQSTETKLVAGPTVSVAGMTVNANNVDHVVNALVQCNINCQTLNTEDYYGLPTPNGNRIDGLTMASTRTSVFTYSTGTSTRTTSVVYPNGQLGYKAPLTAGDTWTSSPVQTYQFTASDTRPASVAYVAVTQNYTENIGADGSLLNGRQTYTYSDGYTGTYISNQNADGSGTYSFTDSTGMSEVDTVGPVSNGSATYAAVISGPGIKTASFSGSVAVAPYPPTFYAESGTTNGQVALDQRCGLSAPSLAYLTTQTIIRNNVGGSRQITTDQRFTQPGLGVVCKITTVATDIWQTSVNVPLTNTDGSFWGNWSTGVPSGITQSTLAVNVRSLQTSTMQSALRSPFALEGGAVFGGTIVERPTRIPHGGRPQ